MRGFSGALRVSMIAAGLATALAIAGSVPAAAVPAPRGCRGGSPVLNGRSVLVIRRDLAVVAVYSAPHDGAGVCALLSDGTSSRGSASGESRAKLPAGAIQVFWVGVSGSPGLVVLFGRVGAGVTAVTIERNHQFAPVHARVAHGWYAVLWSGAPGKTQATRVRITADSSTRTYPLPAGDREGVPGCNVPPGGAGTCSAVGPGQTVGP